jgi:serine/threonine protein kinase
VHRDLKPENILIFEKEPGEYIFKICDFGVSKNVNEDSTSTVSQNFARSHASPE